MGKDPGEGKLEIERTRAELSEDVDTLREQVSQQGGVKGIAGEAAAKAGHVARSEAETKAKEELKSASEKAKKELKSASEKAKKGLNSASENVKKELKSAPQMAKAANKAAERHCVAGMVLALGIGWLVRSRMKPTRRSSRRRA